MSYDSSARAVWTSSSYDSSARPIWISSSYDSSASPVWTSSSYDSSAMPVWTSSSYDSSASPVWMSSCFLPSTLIHTAHDVYIPIGSLKAGDKLLSWDAKSNKMQYTAVTEVHRYTNFEINRFNGDMKVSPSHPLMVLEYGEEGLLSVPKWKRVRDVNVGDFILCSDGKHVAVKSKEYRWFNRGIEVINLSTDGGVPFIACNCVVRANNAADDLEWAISTRQATPTSILLSA